MASKTIGILKKKQIKHFGRQWMRRKIPSPKKLTEGGPQYGKQNTRNRIGISRISGVGGCEEKSQLAENELRIDLSMENKMLLSPRKNQEILVSVGAKQNPNSQKLSLGRTSSWRVTC